ncbi:hypothetical protein MNBD_BACTEROID07-49 [hydrothermal vent metagenome]|uniref:Uncharacterized protein n=1 Tax=hydrothermal vent metagenome TaxID=652676 RepID=A0A3B0UDW4_9ZZZZ
MGSIEQIKRLAYIQYLSQGFKAVTPLPVAFNKVFNTFSVDDVLVSFPQDAPVAIIVYPPKADNTRQYIFETLLRAE